MKRPGTGAPGTRAGLVRAAGSSVRHDSGLQEGRWRPPASRGRSCLGRARRQPEPLGVAPRGRGGSVRSRPVASRLTAPLLLHVLGMRFWTWLAISLALGCGEPPAILRSKEELALLHQIEAAFGRSIDAEKSAVLAQTDEQSEAFAAESRAAAGEVDLHLAQLAKLISIDDLPRQREKLAALEDAWAEIERTDATLLALAVANTNLKAIGISSGKGLRALERVVAALEQAAAQAPDVPRSRELSAAAIAALRIQAWLPAHIASRETGEMDALEVEMGRQREIVEGLLQQTPEVRGDASLDEARVAWAEYRGSLTEVLRLSRENSNVRSFDLSIGEKRRAAAAFRAALGALVAEIRSSYPATR